MVSNPRNRLLDLRTKVSQSQVDATDYSIRFKYGVHTILLFVDSLQSFSAINKSLLEVLRERFPNGLKISPALSDVTPVPTSDDVRIVYGLPNNVNDLSQGWKILRIDDDDKPVSKGLKDNIPVAFAFLADGEELDDAQFLVDVPTLDDEYEDELGSDP
ncbi:uncharacterized protein VDAG_06218 [Verticillium dahliae VdLs.17]|uniref:Uncharacterized protein n=1 Tax=Verticillium dahliae (strain VdLs.17 / ATCC MYA-4575 / FGSC 10137) TaxID=498257 RepID=G2X8S6_VERDV|nr:uncharacterized protein VDAG_06218 [Verticillium dahliae VdLs.17]EGY15364.1 hypothetical protein VDAG_06218 [Verticillium dahliae VdLs.17]KAF3342219.1 Protein yop-1 [Verticillium dahliae VDG2]KAF3359079.1 Ankyrin repeat and death domain-containing protein 1A [Verticillium dahliae VDG1]